MHSRYKDLALVEQAFRISKTVDLEMRPIHVRCEASTRGHALVVMLAYLLPDFDTLATMVAMEFSLKRKMGMLVARR